MNTLTCAELRLYPGTTFIEQLEAHHREGAPVATPEPASVVRRGPPPRKTAPHGALAVARRVDLGRFPGRDRAERMANYLRAHLPRTESWSDESLREYALRLLSTTEVVG
jgi:hypothetical protein